MSAGLSRVSWKRGFKIAPEPHQAVANDEKIICILTCRQLKTEVQLLLYETSCNDALLC